MGYHTVEVDPSEIRRGIPQDLREGDIARSGQRQAPSPDAARSRQRLQQGGADAERPTIACWSAASRPGRPLGNFRDYGTRPDDPNDIVPTSIAASCAAARVFGAWLTHDGRAASTASICSRRATPGIPALHVRLRLHLGSGTVFSQRHRGRQRIHLRAEHRGG